MAEVEDAPADLRALARRIPALTRASLTAFEMTSRCEHAAVLLAEADSITDPAKADRKRSEAGKYLRAMSSASFDAEMGRLGDELADARKRGDDRAAWEAAEDMGQLDRNHPQVPPEKVLDQAMAAVMAGIERKARKLSVPPLPQGNLWSRRNRKRNRGR